MLVKDKKSLEKIVKNFIGCFVKAQCKTVKCEYKRIEKYIDNDNGSKGNNGFNEGVFRSLDAMPPERERDNRNSQKKQSCKKCENFFHIEPPLTSGV